MSGFRILNPFPAYLDRLGMPASGGSLRFYESGTDSPKNVFGDPDLTVNNGPIVLIGSDGRSLHDIWGEGAYRVRLYAADSTLIAEAEDVEIPGGAGAAIPALQDGKYLTNDGSIMAWADILQIPDPTGQSGKILGTDGVNPQWVEAPKTPDPAVSDIDITASGGTFSAGTLKLRILAGTGTAPNVGGRNTNVAIVFSSPFTGDPLFIGITPNYPGSASSYGNAPIPRVSTSSAAGFTAQFTAGELDDSNSNFNFNREIPFKWLAIGLVPA